MAAAQLHRTPAITNRLAIPTARSPHKTMPQPKARYRVICYELRDSRETLIMDSTDDGFIAATGKLDGAVLDGEISHAGPQQLQAELALMITLR